MSRLDALRELLPDLKGWMEEAPADRKAALVAQYRATLQEIAELDPPKAVGDGIDEIAQRRTDRRSRPAAGSRSAKQSV